MLKKFPNPLLVIAPSAKDGLFDVMHYSGEVSNTYTDDPKGTMTLICEGYSIDKCLGYLEGFSRSVASCNGHYSKEFRAYERNLLEGATEKDLDN